MASRALTRSFGGMKCFMPLRAMSTAAAKAPETTAVNVSQEQSLPQQQEQQQQRQLGRTGAGFLQPFLQPGGIFDLWSPVTSSRSMRQMIDSMNRILDVGMPSMPSEGMRGRSPWDIVEKDDSYHLRIDMPGFDKSDVKIHVEGEDEMVIQAEHKGEEDLFGVQRSLNTRMLLPAEAAKGKIKAELKNGVLTILVPKDKDATEKKQVQVNVE